MPVQDLIGKPRPVLKYQIIHYQRNLQFFSTRQVLKFLTASGLTYFERPRPILKLQIIHYHGPIKFGNEINSLNVYLNVGRYVECMKLIKNVDLNMVSVLCYHISCLG